MEKFNLLPIVLGSLSLALVSQCALADCKAIEAAAKASDAGSLQWIVNIAQEANYPPEGSPSPSPSTGGGFNHDVWVTTVDETGKICQVLTSDTNPNSKSNPTGKDKNGHSGTVWLGSRIISAQKASTANAFSLDNGKSISTANLYGMVQPGGSLYGLQHSNPVDAGRAYAGNPITYGTTRDPLVNKRIGGIIAFGGGLALYDANRNKIGAIGVSGDTACTDHTVAWRIRAALGLDNAVQGFASDLGGEKGDELVLDSNQDGTANTVQHPTCENSPAASTDNGVINEQI